MTFVGFLQVMFRDVNQSMMLFHAYYDDVGTGMYFHSNFLIIVLYTVFFYHSFLDKRKIETRIFVRQSFH